MTLAAVLLNVHSSPASMVMCMLNSTSESQDEDSMPMCQSSKPIVLLCTKITASNQMHPVPEITESRFIVYGIKRRFLPV
jgi:hypothetical protein